MKTHSSVNGILAAVLSANFAPKAGRAKDGKTPPGWAPPGAAPPKTAPAPQARSDPPAAGAETTRRNVAAP